MPTGTAELVRNAVGPLLRGLVLGTLPLTAISFVLGLALALLLALMRLSRVRALSATARTYVSLVRGTPLLVQLFIIFYGLPSLGVTIEPFPSAVLAFTLNVGGLFQPAADRRAASARKAWAEAQIEGPVDRAAQAKAKLAAALVEARARLDATTELAGSLEQRDRTLEAITTDAARNAASTTWFALVHARAERAFFAALVEELAQALS